MLKREPFSAMTENRRRVKTFHNKWTRWHAVLLCWLMFFFNASFGRGKGTRVSLIPTLLFGLQAAAQTGAPLAIQPSGTNQFQITWPSGTNFSVLQEATAVAPTNVWLDLPDAPSILGRSEERRVGKECRSR